MHFQHSARLWQDFPALVPAALYVEGITGDGRGRGSGRPIHRDRQGAVGFTPGP